MCTFVKHLHVFLQLNCQLLYRLIHFPQPSCSHSDTEIDEEQKNTKGMENRDQKNNKIKVYFRRENQIWESISVYCIK